MSPLPPPVSVAPCIAGQPGSVARRAGKVEKHSGAGGRRGAVGGGTERYWEMYTNLYTKLAPRPHFPSYSPLSPA